MNVYHIRRELSRTGQMAIALKTVRVETGVEVVGN